MRNFWLACLSVLLLVGSASGADKRPNILWLVGENLSLDLGCYGAAGVKTPNLDRLAAEGVRYTKAFATNPACAPSRSAFFTGMYQTTTDTHHMRSHRDDGFRLPEGVRPITHRLRDAGYFTANIKTVDGQSVGTGKLDLNFVREGPIYHEKSDDWSALKGREPFFAVVNAEESEYDIYDRKSREKPRVTWVGENEHVQHAKPEDVTPPPYYPDQPVVRQEWARYLNSVSGMDRRFGKVLDRLRADGLEEDTVVIFFGDNGRLEPRGIHWCYDSGLHVPLIIRWPTKYPAPQQFKPGTVNEQMVSLVDLTATTLAIAGIDRPPLMQGRVFLGDGAEPPRQYAFAARDRIDETVQRIRSVHDARYHYIRTLSAGPTFASLNRYKEKCFPILPVMRELYEKGELRGAPLELMERIGPCEELYDTQADPHEIANLATSPKPDHQAALIRLRAALDTWIVETRDRGGNPEPPEVIAPFAAEMDQWFGTPDWYRAELDPPRFRARRARAADVFDATQSILFRSNFIEANFDRWSISRDDSYNLRDTPPDRLKVVDAPGLAGEKAARFTVPLVPGRFRSELSLPHEAGYQHRWYAASFFIPEEVNLDESADIVMQWHAIPGNWRATFPNMDLVVRNGQWQLRRSFGNAQEGPTRTTERLAPVRKGIWTRWLFQAQWSGGEAGLIRAWQDGKQVAEFKGPNVYSTIGVEYTPYLKFGIYHPTSKATDAEAARVTAAQVAAAARMVVYVKDVVVADGRAERKEVEAAFEPRPIQPK